MRKASFDRVDEEGNIILSLDGEPIILEASDHIEDALLSSRKIKAQAGAQKRLSPLPISQIQNMVRSGKDVNQISEELQVDQDFIARVAASVEDEKRTAIHQFRSSFYQKSPLGKERISEIISHAFARLGVKGKEIKWSASRDGRGPWKITAQFERDGKKWEAAWAWNLRDNSISSLNDEAKYLLGDDSKPVPFPTPKKPNLPPLPSPKNPKEANLGEEAPAKNAPLKEDKSGKGAEESEEEGAQEVETELVDPCENQAPRIAFQPKGKMQRKGVPSWDDILFGGGVTSPRQSEES
ncbi:MAG: DUF3071 domain-containing protein [Aeriscardovia sp.]|nr:DUF3071 domain-containing protein [Aeriscardovia sp.]